MTKYIDELEQSKIFCNVTKEEIINFLSETNYVITQYKPKEKINPIKDYLMVIVSGAVSKVYTDIDGNQTIANIYDFIEEYVVLTDTNNEFSHMEYYSMVNTLVMFVSRNDMKIYNPTISEIKNKIYNNIMYSFNSTGNKSHLLSIFKSQKGVKNKLKKYIEFQKKLPVKLKGIITKTELSNMLNIDYSSLCRVINQLSSSIPDIEIYFASEKDTTMENRIY